MQNDCNANSVCVQGQKVATLRKGKMNSVSFSTWTAVDLIHQVATVLKFVGLHLGKKHQSMGFIAHLKHTLTLFSLYAKLHFIPIEFHNNFSQISIEKTRFRSLKWRVMWTIGLVHVVFLDLRLLQALLFPEYLNLVHFSLHLMNAQSQTVGLYFCNTMFSTWEDSTVKIYNHIMKPGENKSWVTEYVTSTFLVNVTLFFS